MRTPTAIEEAAILEHFQTLRRYSCSLTRNTCEGEDVAQETVLRALENWDKFTPGSNLRAWLFRISRNIHYDRCRRNTRWNNGVKPILSMDDQSARPNQDDHIEMRQVEAACHTLSDDHQQVISLVSLEGMDYESAADQLGVSVGTIKSRLSRARAALRAKVDGATEEHGSMSRPTPFYERAEDWPEAAGTA